MLQLLKDVQTHSKICQGLRQAFVTGKISCDIPLPAHYHLQHYRDWAIQLIIYEYTVTDTLYTPAGRSSHTKATNVIRLHHTLQMGEFTLIIHVWIPLRCTHNYYHDDLDIESMVPPKTDASIMMQC